MDPSNIILQGNNNQKASQFLALLENKQLSPEQLALLIPSTKDFLQELTSVMKTQTEYDKANYDKIIDESFKLIDTLLLSIKETPSESERLQILTLIDKIHARMTVIQINEKEKNAKRTTIWSIIGAILLGILFILTAGKIRGEKK